MNSTEQRIIQLIEEHKEEIIQIGRSIWQHPELGYKEFRTSRLFCDFVKKFGLEPEQNLAITGAKAYLKDKKEGDITVSLIGEMDALPMADSPHANPETGAPDFTPLIAISFLVFVLLYFPCLASVAAIVKETGSWWWGIFSMVYNTAFAWIVSFLIFNIGKIFI